MADDEVPVPTIRELAERNDGSATAIEWTGDGKASRWVLHEKGRKILADAMHRNALAAIARGEGSWTQPPTRKIGGLNAP